MKLESENRSVKGVGPNWEDPGLGLLRGGECERISDLTVKERVNLFTFTMFARKVQKDDGEGVTVRGCLCPP